MPALSMCLGRDRTTRATEFVDHAPHENGPA